MGIAATVVEANLGSERLAGGDDAVGCVDGLPAEHRLSTIGPYSGSSLNRLGIQQRGDQMGDKGPGSKGGGKRPKGGGKKKGGK